MRIAYVTHTRFPTEKAHGGQIASVCHALSELGHTVTLFQPTVWNAITQDPYKYYGLPESFFYSAVTALRCTEGIVYSWKYPFSFEHVVLPERNP
jgi:hypothetical protein